MRFMIEFFTDRFVKVLPLALFLCLSYSFLGSVEKQVCVPEERIQRAGLIEVRSLDSSIQVDLKYSGTDNFCHRDVYGCLANAYLQPDVAKKLQYAASLLRKEHPGYSFLVYDAVRPAWAQTELWKHMPKPENVKHIYLAHPKVGSIHHYGAAVDLTIQDPNGHVLDMGTAFDFFGLLAQPRCEASLLASGQLTANQVGNRKILRSVMVRAGFLGITSEWWHFNSCSLVSAKRKYKRVE